MNNIPENKQQIYVEATYKEPIEGVPFSNTGLTVGLTKNIYEGKGLIEKEIDSQIDRLCEDYFTKLKAKVLETRNDMIDQLRVEMDEKYTEHIQKLKDEIIKLKKQVK